jgi:NTP pyrophosphatase (non-canonical NTP hydrolase)
MKDSRVERFNVITGKAPSKDIKELYKQIENQCTYLLEEVEETMKAAQEEDMVEVLDGVADVKYVASQLQTLLESVGVDFDGAFSAVCENNDLKFTTLFGVADNWAVYHDKSGKDVYISSVEYEGVNYYTVCDYHTNKTLKPQNFPRVDLKPFIPNDLIDWDVHYNYEP